MNILYDGCIFNGQATGGINRYFANLISRLPHNFTAALTTCQQHQTNFPIHPNLATYHYKRFAFRPGRVSYWLEKYYFRAIETFKRFDLAHPTYYSLMTRRDMHHYRFPIVLTVHDMIHEIFAAQIDPTGEHAELKRKAISSAAAILCVSQNTKHDLLEQYKLPENKVFVTYLASEIDISLSYGSELVPLQPYYLFVGNRASYKNFDALLMAFSKAVSSYPELKLCVIGRPFSSVEQKLISELNISESIHHYSKVSDCHLAKLYRCSVALVYPSLYEGFGIPPLEAMSCGTVAITSNVSSLPEVVGNAGITFDPTSVMELTDALLYVLDHSIERQKLVETGRQWAQKFSWEKTVSQTVEVYRSVI